MIVNMESGNFDGLPRTEWDERLDQASDRPGSQKAEKMISGRYLGELLGTILDSMAGLGLLKHAAGPRSTICGADLDALIAEGGAGPEIARIMRDSLGLGDLGPSDIEAIRGIARAIGRRSARAVAAGFAGALLRIDPDMERPHAIAIDGSLYERMPGYDAQIRAALSDVLGRGAERIRTILAKDGSGLGAAIAAAIASGGN
jgi:hexokinase